MAGNIKLTVGFAVGYVLGARAGREQYEQIVESARALVQRPEVQQATTRVRERLGISSREPTIVTPDQATQAPAGGPDLPVEPVPPRAITDPAIEPTIEEALPGTTTEERISELFPTSTSPRPSGEVGPAVYPSDEPLGSPSVDPDRPGPIDPRRGSRRKRRGNRP
jgi:hypothetical protein